MNSTAYPLLGVLLFLSVGADGPGDRNVVSTRWDTPKGPRRFGCRRKSSVLSRYVLLDSGLYQFCLRWKSWEIWKFGRISNAGSKFVGISGCLSSEVTPVEVVTDTICHSHRTIVHIQHLHIVTLVIRDALLTLRVPKMKSRTLKLGLQANLVFYNRVDRREYLSIKVLGYFFWQF